MTKWRKIETEGLPKEDRLVLWYRSKEDRTIYRIGRLFDDKVTWDDTWIKVRAFTHWAPLVPPKE